MSTQWPHQVSSQKCQNPDSSPTHAHANTRNKPNKETQTAGLPPLYGAKRRSELASGFNSPGSGGYAEKCETNPIHQPKTKKCETNPIPSTAHDSNTRNEPNFRVPLVSRRPQIRKTNPITPGEFAKRTQFPCTKCPATPYLCETNPILISRKNDKSLHSKDLWRKLVALRGVDIFWRGG